MTTEHPARLASQRSMAIVQQKDENAKERWLALFADDAVIEDPIGRSPFDPDGTGHRGKTAIAAFWDMTIATVTLKFDIEKSYACGHEVANVGTITSTLPNGTSIAVPGVFTYRVNDEGKIVALRAYWEFETMMAIMAG